MITLEGDYAERIGLSGAWEAVEQLWSETHIWSLAPLGRSWWLLMPEKSHQFLWVIGQGAEPEA